MCLFRKLMLMLSAGDANPAGYLALFGDIDFAYKAVGADANVCTDSNTPFSEKSAKTDIDVPWYPFTHTTVIGDTEIAT